MSNSNNNNNSSNRSGGIGFCGLLTIVFIVLKILGYIEWSWLWVLAPTWIPLSLIIVIAIIATLISCLMDKKE